MKSEKFARCSLLASSALVAFIGSTAAAQETPTGGLDDIVVTATKQSRNLQDVPVAVQALGSEALRDLNVSNFDDYVRNLPSVRSGGRGPGQNEVYIRGMATDSITVLLSGAQGSQPNVALYLDEQPVTAPGRNLDIYAADLERIEVLPGPQGTLFGASSMAGTVRLITNKPVLGEFRAGMEASASWTRHGEMSNAVQGYINVPIGDRLALRAVIYNDNQGGYIDNVFGTFTPDPALNPALPSAPGTTFVTANNTTLVKKDFNDAKYQGIRLSAKYEISDDWELNLQHMRQSIEADGVFDYDPTKGDLNVSRFFPDELNDDFSQTAWTVNGELGPLSLIYTGAYLDRKISQSVDYTGYTNVGAFQAYYTCDYGYATDRINPGNRDCLNPVKGFKGQQFIKRFTNEFRISTDQKARFRVTAGVYYDSLKIGTLDDFLYLATPDLGFFPNAPITGARNINPNVRPQPVAFFNDITRKEKQLAFFGEASFEILRDRLTATVGLRHYSLRSDFYGSSNFANGPFATGDSTLIGAGGRDYDRSFGHTTAPLKQKDWIPKFTLTYTPTDELLFYATYSEGFRPGGFNRGGGAPSFNPTFPTVPLTYGSDGVKNYELGFKTQFADNRVRFNGSFYRIDWTDIQVSRFDSVNVSLLTFIDNAADARINGFEGELTWAVTDRFTLSSAVSFNDAKLRALKSQVIELAPAGSELPLTPKFQGNIRGRYEGPLTEDTNFYAQAAVQHAGRTFSSIVAADRRAQKAYTTVDLSLGVKRDMWSIELFGENVFDERAQLFFNTQDDIARITTNRPATFGLKVTFDYK